MPMINSYAISLIVVPCPQPENLYIDDQLQSNAVNDRFAVTSIKSNVIFEKSPRFEKLFISRSAFHPLGLEINVSNC